MDKLESKFEDIYFEHVMYKDGGAFRSVKIYAEETKKIAIAYALWKSIQPKRVIKLSDYPDTVTTDEIYRIELEKEFEQFIEKCYV